jgi:hypothetical protein
MLLGLLAVNSFQVGAGQPAVRTTAYGQGEDRRRGRDAGFDLHLTTTVDCGELQQLLGLGWPQPIAKGQSQ